MTTLQLKKPWTFVETLSSPQPAPIQGLNATKSVRFQRLQAVCIWFCGLVGALLGFYLVRATSSEPSAWLSSLSFAAVGASCGQLIAGVIDVVVFGSIEDSRVEES